MAPNAISSVRFRSIHAYVANRSLRYARCVLLFPEDVLVNLGNTAAQLFPSKTSFAVQLASDRCSQWVIDRSFDGWRSITRSSLSRICLSALARDAGVSQHRVKASHPGLGRPLRTRFSSFQLAFRLRLTRPFVVTICIHQFLASACLALIPYSALHHHFRDMIATAAMISMAFGPYVFAQFIAICACVHERGLRLVPRSDRQRRLLLLMADFSLELSVATSLQAR